MNPIRISLNDETFQLGCSFNILNRITESDIKNTIFNTHEYIVQSRVGRPIFEQFWKYLETGLYPKIDSDNYLEFLELSDEFGAMGDYFSKQSIDHLNLQNLFVKIQTASRKNPQLEKIISQNLDECIATYSSQLKIINITVLYNIFSHPSRILNNHDKAYFFIIDTALKQDSNFFILLGTLDATKFTNIEYLRDAAFNQDKHLQFCPQNVNHYISILENKIKEFENPGDQKKQIFDYDQINSSKKILLLLYKSYQDDPSPYFNCGLNNGNLFEWTLIVNGVENTLLSGGLFPAALIFPDNYLISWPTFKFKCPMWHPNIDPETGEICPFTSNTNYDPSVPFRWNPTETPESIVIHVILILQEPNPESILNDQAYNEFINDRENYNRKLRSCVRKSIEYI